MLAVRGQVVHSTGITWVVAERGGRALHGSSTQRHTLSERLCSSQTVDAKAFSAAIHRNDPPLSTTTIFIYRRNREDSEDGQGKRSGVLCSFEVCYVSAAGRGCALITRLRPPALARYSAASAVSTSVSMEKAPLPGTDVAQPALTVT